MTTKELGDLGEKLACEYLVGKGLDILGRNFKIKFGEIDIIARQKRGILTDSHAPIHFIEVKTLINNEGFLPEDHVDYRKQRKLKNLAQIWLSKNKFSLDTPCQIDVIAILVNEQTRNAKLHYFPNTIADN